jgi:hypothetical protein
MKNGGRMNFEKSSETGGENSAGDAWQEADFPEFQRSAEEIVAGGDEMAQNEALQNI